MDFLKLFILLSVRHSYSSILEKQDQNIIRGLQSGDHSAIEKIYDHYAGALLGIILRMNYPEEIAKEILQEGFTKIWKNGHSYDPAKGRLFSWMVRIMKNTAINYVNIKSEKKQAQVISIDSLVENNRIQTFNIDVLDIKGKVGQLEPQYKKLIELIYFKGYTQQEASDHLEMPLGTVKTRIRKALNELRNVYVDKKSGIMPCVSIMIFAIILAI